MNRKDMCRREWRTSLYQKRERARQERALKAVRKQAGRYIRYLQTVEFPGKSLLQLLPIILKYGPELASEVAVEWIELSENLSADDREFLQQVKDQLAERTGQKGLSSAPH